ncbi:hypothetical protein ACFL3P_05375, partial [Pseudomonadota bacterium]
SDLILRVDPSGESNITSEFKNKFIEYLSYEITRDAIDSGVVINIYNEDSYDESEIEDFVNERLSEIAVEFNSSEVDEVVGCCEIDEIIESNMNSIAVEGRGYEDRIESRDSSISSISPIDDLFDRG